MNISHLHVAYTLSKLKLTVPTNLRRGKCPRGSSMLELVKDFESFQFFFYWIDSGTRKRVSPKLPTVEYAKEWWLSYNNRSFCGVDRRRRKYDRRERDSKVRLTGTQIFFSKRKPQTCQGRRVTDRPVFVSIDLAVPKLARLKG